jgi:orotidine-5'-phosphate decarboxylase
MASNNKNRLIVALDVPTVDEALRIAGEIKGSVNSLKIGKQIFTAAGCELIKKLQEDGFRIFLDLKFHDIPNTVASAGIEATKLGVFMFNVHTSGGYDMMKTTVEKVHDFSEKNHSPCPFIIGVTVLTSLGDQDLKVMGFKNNVRDQVRLLASLAKKAGLDGVVASAQEIKLIKEVCGQDFIVVTPGIRPTGSPPDDQKRTVTASEAFAAGADYIVVGRPITSASDKVKAVRDLIG